MGIAIRRLALEAERQLLIDFLYRHLTRQSTERRFGWLYLGNPSGHAQVWVAENPQTREMVGASAVFPRRLYINGRQTLGFVLGDFCIHPDYRSLGPAVRLQRACLEEMNPEIRTMGYDLPGDRMLPVHRRLGIAPQDRLIRLAKPLRVNRKVAGKIPMKGLVRGLSSIGNKALKWRDAVRAFSAAHEIAWHQGPCGEEFSTLAARVSAGQGITTARTAAYLNWRYLSHPLRHFEILTARCDGVLAGYLILTREAEDACVVDLFGIEDWELLSSLLAYAVEFLRGLAVVTVNTHVLATHRWMRLFARSGFAPRDSCPVVFYPSFPKAVADREASATSWFLMDGDRES
jgi:GNAT superfamily N-acetyltransferase